VQFLAAAFILIEIVGPERFKSASNSIAKWPTPFRRGLLSIRKIGRWLWAFLTSLPKLGLLLSLIFMPIGLIVVALAHFGVVELPSAMPSASAPASAPVPASAVERVLVATGDIWASQVVVTVFAIGLGVFGCLVAYSLLVAALTKFVELISAFLSWLTGHTRLQVGAKLLSWILFVIGFALDFMAS
jgi:hypothetical protein